MTPSSTATPETASRGEEIRLRAAHLRLAAVAWGSPSARRVLALHGWLDNAASFSPLAPHLTGVRCVGLDLPGHGRSQHRPPGTAYHFVDYVPAVLDAVDALGWQRFALLGHSLGAGIASIVAAVAPERVERLALIEGLGPLTAEPSQAPDRLLQSLEQSRALAAKQPPLYPHAEAATRARHAVGGLSEHAARLLAARNSRSRSGGVTWRTDPRLRVGSPLLLTERHVLAFLERIEAPVMLIRGRSGHLHDRPFMQARYESVPRLDVVDLDGGHHLHMDDPQAVAAVLNAFLAVA